MATYRPCKDGINQLTGMPCGDTNCDPAFLAHQKARLRQGQVLPRGGKSIEQAIAELDSKCGTAEALPPPPAAVQPPIVPSSGSAGGGGGIPIVGGGGGFGGGGGGGGEPVGGGGGGGILAGLAGGMATPDVSLLISPHPVRQGIGTRIPPTSSRILASLARAY